MPTTLEEKKNETSEIFHEEEHVPNAETIKILRDSEAGRNVIGPFHNMNDFMKSLLSDDDA